MFGLDTRLEPNVFELLMQCLIREGVSGRFVQVLGCGSGSIDFARGDKSGGMVYGSGEKLERTTTRELEKVRKVCLTQFRDGIDALTSGISNSSQGLTFLKQRENISSLIS